MYIPSMADGCLISQGSMYLNSTYIGPKVLIQGPLLKPKYILFGHMDP